MIVPAVFPRRSAKACRQTLPPDPRKRGDRPEVDYQMRDTGSSPKTPGPPPWRDPPLKRSLLHPYRTALWASGLGLVALVGFHWAWATVRYHPDLFEIDARHRSEYFAAALGLATFAALLLAAGLVGAVQLWRQKVRSAGLLSAICLVVLLAGGISLAWHLTL